MSRLTKIYNFASTGLSTCLLLTFSSMCSAVIGPAPTLQFQRIPTQQLPPGYLGPPRPWYDKLTYDALGAPEFSSWALVRMHWSSAKPPLSMSSPGDAAGVGEAWALSAGVGNLDPEETIEHEPYVILHPGQSVYGYRMTGYNTDGTSKHVYQGVFSIPPPL